MTDVQLRGKGISSGGEDLNKLLLPVHVSFSDSIAQLGDQVKAGASFEWKSQWGLMTCSVTDESLASLGIIKS